MSVPEITAEIVFLHYRAGGRFWPPQVQLHRRGYRPHIVLQGREVRREIAEGNTNIESYLGVAFESGPEVVLPGESCVCTLKLIYNPHVDYSSVLPGATFTIREGPTIVGHGVVLDRIDPQPDE